MQIRRKDGNLPVEKRLREARGNLNKNKAEFAAALDVMKEHYRKTKNFDLNNFVSNSSKEQRSEFFQCVLTYLYKLIK